VLVTVNLLSLQRARAGTVVCNTGVHVPGRFCGISPTFFATATPVSTGKWR
jgi:hypothetical protein